MEWSAPGPNPGRLREISSVMISTIMGSQRVRVLISARPSTTRQHVLTCILGQSLGDSVRPASIQTPRSSRDLHQRSHTRLLEFTKCPCSFHSVIPRVIFLSFGRQYQSFQSVPNARLGLVNKRPDEDFSITVLLSTAEKFASTQINTRLPTSVTREIPGQAFRPSASASALEAKLVCAALSIFHPPITCCNIMLKCPSNRSWQ